ncbi:MAG: hypothetical protein ACREP9_11250, partial [Candidatus Dormibacteraceae bacterium]
MRPHGRRTTVLILTAVGVMAMLTASGPPTMAGATKARPFILPAIRHIWNIILENEDYASTFGDPSADPYLATTLPAEGALLENYYGT